METPPETGHRSRLFSQEPRQSAEPRPQNRSTSQRRGKLRGRVVEFVRVKLHLAGGSAAVRRENDRFNGALPANLAERFGPAIARRSVPKLRSAPKERCSIVDREAVAAGIERARSIAENVRVRPEVQPFLPGGAEFHALSRKFELTSASALRTYELSLIDSLAAAGSRRRPDPIATRAESAAKASVEFVVRRTDAFNMSYRDCVAELARNAGTVRRFGSFETRCAGRNEPFARFAKTDSDGVRLTKSKDRPVKSHKDKVHLSVHVNDLPKAWEALRPLLLSPDNPFLKWKMTIPDNAERSLHDGLLQSEKGADAGQTHTSADRESDIRRNATRRLTEGMQFTLYAFAGARDPDYRDNGSEIRHFLTLADWALADSGVRPGTKPESDVAIEGLEFATYRNGIMGTRGAAGGEHPVMPTMLQNLKNTRFYRAISP